MISAADIVIQRTRVLGAQLRTSRTLHQTTYLYACQVAGIALGFVVNLMNTRLLGPADYGLFAATFAATEFVINFLDFGFFPSGARVLALQQRAPEKQRETIGALIVIATALSCAGAIALWAASFVAVRLLNAPIERYLRWFCLLLGLLTLQTLVEAACRGTGQIKALSFFNVSSKGLGLILTGLAIASGTFSLTVAIGVTLVGSLVACIHVFSVLRPSFGNIGGATRELWQDVKYYGVKAYTGDIASSASLRTDSLILAHWANATAVGYYRLAVLVMTPMITFSRALATTMFNRFAEAPRLAGRVWVANCGWLAFCLVGVLVFGTTLVHVFFGAKYAQVAGLLPLTALAALFSGLTVPLNKFLGAHGRGNYVRTIAFLLSISSIVLMFGLISTYGIMGACYASAGSALINFLLNFYFYRRTVRSLL